MPLYSSLVLCSFVTNVSNFKDLSSQSALLYLSVIRKVSDLAFRLMVEVVTEHTFREEDQHVEIKEVIISKLLKALLFPPQDLRIFLT